jgi:esterase/lipase superfamily enzyme
MIENYHKWYSQYINKEFEMLVFGSEGIPVIFFPPAGERYFTAKDKSLLDSLEHLLESGKIKLYTPDGYDNESWYNFSLEPYERVNNYKNFEQLIIHDLIGFTHFETDHNKVILAGTGSGGYHALNFGLKHPDLISGIISIGGLFNIKQFIHGFYNDDCYFNNPSDYLPGLTDEWYLENIKKMHIYLVSEEGSPYLPENQYISSLLTSKGLNHRLIVEKPDDLWEITKNHLPFFLNLQIEN